MNGWRNMTDGETAAILRQGTPKLQRSIISGLIRRAKRDLQGIPPAWQGMFEREPWLRKAYDDKGIPYPNWNLDDVDDVNGIVWALKSCEDKRADKWRDAAWLLCQCLYGMAALDKGTLSRDRIEFIIGSSRAAVYRIGKASTSSLDDGRAIGREAQKQHASDRARLLGSFLTDYFRKCPSASTDDAHDAAKRSNNGAISDAAKRYKNGESMRRSIGFRKRNALARQ